MILQPAYIFDLVVKSKYEAEMLDLVKTLGRMQADGTPEEEQDPLIRRTYLLANMWMQDMAAIVFDKVNTQRRATEMAQFDALAYLNANLPQKTDALLRSYQASILSGEQISSDLPYAKVVGEKIAQEAFQYAQANVLSNVAFIIGTQGIRVEVGSVS